ncbi:MAG: transcriptional regulator [Alphaproteobacteria bacterium CG11_big_fil_rev_8_21_14_0_20_39_49]|nr:MAG: transcriptional regulator [Alphaproteobacteria bacterium CG11_big_fil_rev_8_21_14_0_20_39_49]
MLQNKTTTTIDTKPLPETGFVRLPQILERIPIGKSTWWAGVKSGRFKKPIKLYSNVSVWEVEYIKELIESYKKQDSE